MTGDDAHFDKGSGKQPQAPIVDPTNEDSQSDRTEAVTQPKRRAQKEVEVIVISPDSEPGPGQEGSGSQPKNCARKCRGRARIFRVFNFLFGYKWQRAFPL